MAQVQHLCVVTPDDVEFPLQLIESALDSYLRRDHDVRHSIHIELIDANEGHLS